eukprot:jgi/Chlat1/3410/Chrsp23S03738
MRVRGSSGGVVRGGRCGGGVWLLWWVLLLSLACLHRVALGQLENLASMAGGDGEGLVSGLYVEHGAAVPLEWVKVDARVVDMIAEVRVEQRYRNTEAVPIEATYFFPLDERAAVGEFHADVAGRRVEGVVKEKTQEKPDIFQLKVGNLPPGGTAVISITYVTELQLHGDEVRFLLPTTVAPRYTPMTGTELPIHYDLSSDGAGSYALNIHIHFDMLSAIRSISSPTHEIKSDINGVKGEAHLLYASAALDKDLVLLVSTEESSKPRLCIETNEDGSSAAMITLVPRFELDDVKTELIFIIDRSGSMEGPQISQARAALQLCLRSMPQDAYFNIVGFGSHFDMLFPKSVKYNDRTLREAAQYASMLDANFGGTEILQPLHAVYNMPRVEEAGYTRQVFVYTDGQVFNTEAVLSLVRTHNNTARTFALGIGDGVSHHLVQGIARAGKGTAEFVHGNERIEKTVIQQLKQALQPALTDIKIDWGVAASPPAASPPEPPKEESKQDQKQEKSLLGFFKPKPPSEQAPNPPPASNSAVKQAPFSVPPVFSNTRFLVYAFFKPGTALPSAVTITAQTPNDGPLVVTLPAEPNNTYRGNIVHRMAARALIRDFEEGSSHLHQDVLFKPSESDLKREIVDIAVRFGLASSETAFIAVEERADGEKVALPMQARPVPVYPPASQARFLSASTGFPVTSRSRGFSGGGFGGVVSGFTGMFKKNSLFGATPPPPAMPQQAFAAAPMAAPAPGSKYMPSGRTSGPGMIQLGAGSPVDPQMATTPNVQVGSSPAAYGNFGASGAKPDESLMPKSGEAPSGSVPGSFGALEAKARNSTMRYRYARDECYTPARDESYTAPPTLSMDATSSNIYMRSAVDMDDVEEQQGAVERTGGDVERAKLERLVLLQSSNGSFSLTEELAAVMAVTLDDVKDLLPAITQGRADIVGTALSLAFLKAKLASLCSEWELLADKAQRWLTGVLRAANVDSTSVMESANGFITSH